MSHRIAFDPKLPLVASTDFMAGEHSVKVGGPVDLKKLGVTEQVALEWWRSGMISHPEGAPLPPVSELVDQAAGAAADLAAGKGSTDEVVAATSELVAATEPADDAKSKPSHAKQKHAPKR